VPRATLNGVILAQGDHTESDTLTDCPCKGDAGHYTVEAGGERVEDAAWYYPEPKVAAKNIKDHVAFYGNKVRVEG
jgi:uncharacterized protein (DUF427 family)